MNLDSKSTRKLNKQNEKALKAANDEYGEVIPGYGFIIIAIIFIIWGIYGIYAFFN